MKSLDQIASTGIALTATNAPGDSNHHFIISQPGSYYLTGNLAVTRVNGMRVTSHTRARGGRIAFDTNFRPRGWPEQTMAQAAYRRVFDHADLVLASTEDLELLFGSDRPAELLARTASAELVLKLPRLACHVLAPGIDVVVEAEPVSDVVDTTAAGDSFAAAYLAARLDGAEPAAAARAGHELAGTVVRYPGAIIPPAAMPRQPIKGRQVEPEQVEVSRSRRELGGAWATSSWSKSRDRDIRREAERARRGRAQQRRAGTGRGARSCAPCRHLRFGRAHPAWLEPLRSLPAHHRPRVRR